MKRIIWLVVAILAAGGLYAFAYRSAQPTGAPAGQVRAAILDAVAALQQGNTGAAMSIVSSDYKDSTGLNRDRLYLLARQAAQSHAYWSAVVEDVAPQVQGDTAQVQVTVTVRRGEGGGSARHSVDLTMRRESVMEWLIVPTTRWRVVSASGLPTDEFSAFDL